MQHEQRERFRAASRIRDCVARDQHKAAYVSLPEGDWRRCCDIANLLRQAALRGWPMAAASLRQRLTSELYRLEEQLRFVHCAITEGSGPPMLPSVRELYDDLVALDQEFEEVHLSLEDTTISVVTEPIVLDDVPLGRFEVVLNWSQIGDSSPYEVKALDANPAEKSDDVTHPHVSDNQLCEGESRAAFQKRLREGRLLDFFLLARQGLNSYNPASPYARLDEWHHGLSCCDCGDHMPADDSNCCNRCGRDVCNDCVSSCQGCQEYYCGDCFRTCRHCQELSCVGCFSRCGTCGREFCDGCLTDDLCPTCHENQTEDDDDNTVEHAADTGAALQPVCLGQAVVPA